MGKNYYQGPKSDHFDGKRFVNAWNHQKHSFWTVLYWKMTSKQKPWPTKVQGHPFDTPPKRVNGSELRVSFVGHSTMLIQTQGINIITDPIWSNRASPFQNFGPRRYTEPGIPFEQLPPIDIILISHNHYDHLDIPTIKRIWNRDHSKIITPLGNDKVIHSKAPGIPVEILDWHQSIQFEKNVTIHLTPSQHFSSRGLFDKNKALWGAFVISTKSGNIYFGGDSGYGDGHSFRKAHMDFGAFRFAMLPIGAYEPRWFLKYVHMNPEEAIQVYKDLGEPYSAAIHFETFRLTDEGFEDPRNALIDACEKFKVDPQRFRALKVGEAWMVPEMKN